MGNEALRALCVLVAMALLSAVGAPRLWLSGIAGMLLNPFVAFPVAMAGSLAGNYALFLALRSGRAKKLAARLLRERKLPAAAQAAVGISGVVLVRQMPVPGIVSAIILAGTKATNREFLWGSVIGFAPSTLIAVLVTGAAKKFLPENASIWVAVAMSAIALPVWLVKNRCFRKAGKAAGGTTPEAGSEADHADA